MTISSETELHPVFPVVVKVKVRLPLAISAAFGVYVAFKDVLLGLKVPVPPLHIPPVAMVTLPDSDTLALLAQTL